MTAVGANNTRMYYKAGIMTEYTELPYLMEVPEMGGTPEKIDVTVLTDTVKKYMHGIKDMGDFIFKFLYDNSDTTSNYRILKGLQDENTAAQFKLSYPDGTNHLFTALPAVKMDAAAINGALTFSCTMSLQSDITVENPSAGA